MNRFSIAWPTYPCAGLSVVPICSKVMTDFCVTHHTPPCFFGGVTYCRAYCTVLFCPATQQKMMFPLLPPLEQVVPIVGIVATSHRCTCVVYLFGCCNVLLLAWNERGFGRLLHWPRNSIKLNTCSVLCNRIAC